MLYILPLIVFAALLFIGGKPCRKGEWNDEALSRAPMQTLRGLAILGVMLHHMGQKTAAPWLPESVIVHGLDGFVYLGYLFVSVFFFASSYGLYKSLKTKDDYLDGFFARRMLPVVLAFGTTSLVYYLVGHIASTYTWYVAAILFLYAVFCLSFRHCRSDGPAITVLALSTVVYALFCDSIVLGTWWYNTVGIFTLGVLFAKFDAQIMSFLRRRYIVTLILALAVFLTAYFVSVDLDQSLYFVVPFARHEWMRVLTVTLQFVAACAFMLLLILVGMKFRFHNRALDFLSSISLELYLIHGLFVQLFGWCYFNAGVRPLYYIRSVPLYVLTVLALSIPSAWLLHKLHGILLKFFAHFAENNEEFMDTARRDIKKFLSVAGIVIAAGLVIGTVITAATAGKRKAAVQAYSDKYISYADVDGKKMAAYITGSGENTIVFLRGMNDPCPSLTGRTLADKLAPLCRVVLLDSMGSGFSDDPTTERTIENMSSEIHTALAGLGIGEGYILAPEGNSGPIAQYYVKQYPDEVKAVIGLDAECYALAKAELDAYGIAQIDYVRSELSRSRYAGLGLRLLHYTGLDTFVWQTLTPMYNKGLASDELPVAQELYFTRFYNAATRREIRAEYDRFAETQNIRYPSSVPVTDLLSRGSVETLKTLGIDSGAFHTALCKNSFHHTTVLCPDIITCALRTPEQLTDVFREAMEK